MTSRRRAHAGVAAVIAALIVATVGGCGGGGASATKADGKALFVQTGCGACHALKAAGTTGSVGPDLDARKPGKSVVQTFVRNGSGQMPAFGNRLSSDQINALADYVSSAVTSGGTGS